MTRRDPQIQQWLDGIRDNQFSRRQLLKRGAALGLAVPAVSALLAACDPDDTDVDDDLDDEAGGVEPMPDDDDPVDDDGEDEPVDDDVEAEPVDDEDADDIDEEARYGGSLYLAQIGEPPSLDIHATTASATAINAWQMVEPLFTWDEDLELMMDLAEDFEVSDDGLTNTVYLREGVNFHNGDVMTAEDVLASIERWASMSGLGGDLMETVDDVEIVDDHTLEFHMNTALGAFTTMLARQNQGCGIYPASVLEEADETSLPEYVGTGPFRFVEQIADQHIRYERFEDYTERPEEPSGYGGRKTAYLDEMFFVPVPDEASRIAGLQAGDFHYLESIIADHFETLEADDEVVAELLPPTSWGTLVINTAEGIMSDQAMRQAVQAALDHEELATAGYGAADYFRLDPSLMFEETAWHSTVGEELFSPADPDRAAELAEEAGYNGEPIRILATQEYTEYYNFAIVAEQQLEDAGFDVEVTVVDWATLTEQREDPGAWDLYTTAMAFRIDPVGLPFMMGTTWPGWWDSDRKVELTEQLQQEIEFEDRVAIWEDVQELFYEEVPLIKIADQFSLNARSPQLRGFQPFVQLSPFFWNVWLDE
jgi:peptide/nickel transport system substrate-binding protein